MVRAATLLCLLTAARLAFGDWEVKRTGLDPRLVTRYKQLLHQQPDDAQALRKLIDLYKQHRSLDALDRELADAARTGDAGDKLAAGHLARARGDHAEAAKRYEGARTAAPQDARVLALHGYADPLVPPQQVLDFATEMTEAKVDWQLHAYGGVLHAFTVPEANDLALGALYDARAARRSWQAMLDFYEEIFD